MKSSTNFKDVGLFHRKFGLHETVTRPVGPTGAESDEQLMMFRIGFMHEELEEFEVAYESGELAGMADALIDLVYVAMGTAHFLGIPWEEMWNDVQRANITKERAAADGSNSTRGSSFDVIKPEGWVPPRTEEILRKHGFVV